MAKEIIKDCEFFNVCKAACGGNLDDIEMCSCYELFKQLKRAEQKLEKIKERLTAVSYLAPQSTRILKMDIENIIKD